MITQKNRAKLDLNQAVSNGYSPELIRQLADVYEPLYRQVVEIKERVKQAEINAREQTEKWLAERKDEG